MKDFPSKFFFRIFISILIYHSLIMLFNIGKNNKKENDKFINNANDDKDFNFRKSNNTFNESKILNKTSINSLDNDKEMSINIDKTSSIIDFNLKKNDTISFGKRNDSLFSKFSRKRINLIIFLISIGSLLFLFVIYLDKKRKEDLKLFNGDIKYQLI